MDIPKAETHRPEWPAALPRLPQIWIGYLIGFATIIAEFVAAAMQPELPKAFFVIPPVYVFLPAFVGFVYWLVCVHRYHLILADIPGVKYPVSPARAVGFHFIPVYNFYWLFKWPQVLAKFINVRLGRPLMKPGGVGFAVLTAFMVRFIVDAGLGLILLFVTASYISACLRHAVLSASPAAAGEP
jgi:hypothetical protein